MKQETGNTKNEATVNKSLPYIMHIERFAYETKLRFFSSRQARNKSDAWAALFPISSGGIYG